VKVVEEQPMSVADACKALMARGVPGDGLYPKVAQHYPDGVPPGELDALIDRLLGRNTATPLRAVAG
jgi:hypothetical protein